MCALLSSLPASVLAEDASRDPLPSDIAATHAYLEDLHRLSAIEERDAPASEAAVRQLIANVQNHCPKVLADAPETKPVGDFRFQVFLQLAGVGRKSTLHALTAFTRQVKQLHWSNHELTYYIHGAAEEAEANAKIVAPAICPEARAIVASDYEKKPPPMARFEREVNAANSKVTIVVRRHEKLSGSLEERILELLKPYEQPNDKHLLPRRPSKAEINRGLKRFLAYETEMYGALGLAPNKPEAKS
jgi:hypothetical protein